ncbi:MAG: putative lipid II flippase FtsW [Proteobacteria bacterium]|nr:putative lipid II flippase FtsW [Pseudomonadota bacterium]
MNSSTAYRSNRPYDDSAFDGLLAGVIAVIVLFGFVMVFSSGVSGSIGQFELRFSHLLKHGVHILAGLGFMFLAMYVKLDVLQANSKLLLLTGMFALAVLMLPGVGIEINGSTRWFSLAGVRVQPAELMKLICLIYVADYYARKQNSVHLFKVGVLNLGLPVVVVGVLLLLQPDFGTLVVIVATTAGLMFLAGVRFGYFVAAIVLSLMALALIAMLEPYRVERLLTYQNPWADPFDSGFQLTQALMAVGRGGWLGVGLGNSLQKLSYLPHADNDFLIAIIAEELGAFGVMAVMILFALFLWRAFRIASRALEKGFRFEAYLAYGIGLLLVFNAGIHVGVNTGILPTKGLNLPLMSAGGSSMVTTFIAIGLLFAVDRKTRSRPRIRSMQRKES